jgi:hypothetical protein
MVFSLLLAGCNDVPRPNSNICVLNVGALKKTCQNLLTDYDEDGNLKPDAKPSVTIYPTAEAMLLSLDKSIDTEAAGWANIKAYIRNLRSAN